ncbi:MAG: DNA polymerase III subunit beta [Trueperaceae bacterium]
MRTIVPRKQLADTLGHVERIIPNRSSNPNLSLLQIHLSEQIMTLSGSNLDIDLEANIPADIESEGHYALPAHVFGQVVRALPGELVELTFNDNELEIVSGTYGTKLQLASTSGMNPLEFPLSYSGALEASKLSLALGNVRYAAAVAEYQAIFRGVKLELDDKKTRTVATDGFRLAYYNLPEASGLDGSVVIPSRSVEEIIKLLGGGEVKLSLDNSQLSFASGPFRANVKLMEGTFPDYNRVIPANFPINITVNGKALAEAVSRVALMADKSANNRVDMFVKDGNLQITAEGSYGRSQEALEVQQEGTESEMALAYNAKYLTDALVPAEGDIQLRFSGTTSPSVFSSLTDPNYLAMVVPLRTS